MNTDSIEKLLDKIFSSGSLSGEVDKKLLLYLLDAKANSRVLKENEIAQEFFKRDNNFDPLDSSIVRSHIHSLRKKLENYYKTDGANDKIKLIIPKGYYKIEFLNEQEFTPKKSSNQKILYIAGFIILLLLIIIVYFWTKISDLQNKDDNYYLYNHPVWKDFLNSELPTLLVIGDYYVYQKTTQNKEKEIFIRDTELNSDEDFENYLKKNPDEKENLSKTRLTYLGSETPTIVNKLTGVFVGNEDKLRIKLSSELLWSDIRKHNVIFLGSPKTLGKMRHFANQLRFKINLFPHVVYYTPNYKDTVNTYPLISYHQDGFHDDYSVMAKIQTSDKNHIILIASFSSFGIIEILNELISPFFKDNLKNQKIIENDFTSNFEILFKVHGIDKTGLNIQVVHFHPITSDIR